MIGKPNNNKKNIVVGGIWGRNS